MQSLQVARPRWYRRRWGIALLALVGALAIAVPVAWASDLFADVPNTNPFHDDISAIRNAGITKGCNAESTLYCPSDNVTREAMAAFMHRGYGRASQNGNSGTAIGTTAVDLAVLPMTIGGAAGGTQFVKLDAQVTTYITSITGCPCTTTYRITQDGVGTRSFFHYNTNADVGSGGIGLESGGATAVVAVPTGTTQTFRLVVNRIFDTAGSVTGYGNLTAMTAPFGRTGGNTLGTFDAKITGVAGGNGR